MHKTVERRSIMLRMLGVFAALSIGLTGCQTVSATDTLEQEQYVDLPPLSTLSPVADPSEVTGPSSVVIASKSSQPIAKNPESELPATVISKDLDGGRPEITVTDTSRIIALSVTGTLADYVHALGFGDNLVGRDTSTTAPGTADLPLITKAGHTINEEGVLGLQPTLVLTDGSIGPDDVVRLQLREAGVTVVSVERVTDFDSTYTAARDVASALGVAELGEELVTKMSSEIDAKIAEIQTLLPDDPEKLPRVAFLYLRGTAGVYFLFGEGSGVDSTIEAVGAIDVAKEIGWTGEKPLTPEALPAIDPDVILVMTKGLESVGGVDSLIAELSGVAQTTAGKNRRIINIDDKLLFAGGTRTPDVLDGIARALYAPDSLQSIVLD